MNKDQFIYWLKGFVDAVEVSPTQHQWVTILNKLSEIKDCPDFGSPIGVGGWGVANTKVANTKSIITDGFVQNSSITRVNPHSTLTTTNGTDVVYTLGQTGTSKDCILNELRKDDSKDS